MKVLISGSKEFNNPQVFRRAMGVVLSDLADSELTLVLAGAANTSEIARQFVNLSEEPLRLRGKTIRYVHVAPDAVDYDEIDTVVVCVLPSQKNTALGHTAADHGVNVEVFRY